MALCLPFYFKMPEAACGRMKALVLSNICEQTDLGKADLPSLEGPNTCPWGQKWSNSMNIDSLESLASIIAKKIRGGKLQRNCQACLCWWLYSWSLFCHIWGLKAKAPWATHRPHCQSDPSLRYVLHTDQWDRAQAGYSSFPNGSAGQPDGLMPQHLKKLTGSSACGGSEFQES